MSKVIHIIGAPASGKTTLRKRLESATGLPSIAIDDEREKVLLPGETWPSRDDLAWQALREHVERHPASIVETGGMSNSQELLRGHQALTIMAKASHTTRMSRLQERARQGGPMIGSPQQYVDRLFRMDDPEGPFDYLWRSDDDADAAFGAVWASVRDFTAQ